MALNPNQKPASFVITLDDYIAEQQKSPEVADRLSGDEVQKAIGKTAEEFGLDPAALSVGIEYAILKKDMAVYLPDLLRENLNIDQSTAVKAAKKVAETIFPIFKNRLAEKEKYQELWIDVPKAPLLKTDAPKGREAKGSASVAAPTAAPLPSLAPKSGFEKRIVAETEIEITKNKKEAEVTAVPAKSLDEALSAKTKAIIAESNLTFTDPNLGKRLEAIISARLRDVRDESETKEMLMRGDKVGGLGLNAEQTQRVLNLLSAATAEFQSLYKKEEAAKKDKFIREQAEKDALRRGEREKREGEEREKLYARVTGTSPVTALKNVPPKRAAILETSTPLGRPKMEEVKFVPKVRGPLEELKTMSLTEFRRMSKNPKEAAEKIKDKIELLGSEDFGKQVAGVQAWQESGVNQLYLGLLKESLGNGVPISAVIEEKSRGGAEALTKEEFDAIMELNQDLRF